jgi:hypothetical protein
MEDSDCTFNTDRISSNQYTGTIDSSEHEEDTDNNYGEEENYARCEDNRYNMVTQECHEGVASRYARDSRSPSMHPIAFNFQDLQPVSIDQGMYQSSSSNSTTARNGNAMKRPPSKRPIAQKIKATNSQSKRQALGGILSEPNVRQIFTSSDKSQNPFAKRWEADETDED